MLAVSFNLSHISPTFQSAFRALHPNHSDRRNRNPFVPARKAARFPVQVRFALLPGLFKVYHAHRLSPRFISTPIMPTMTIEAEAKSESFPTPSGSRKRHVLYVSALDPCIFPHLLQALAAVRTPVHLIIRWCALV
jgi:hypothetical protein